jgi:hypothetical protein
MSLRERYARHLLLPQVGEAGQRRLLETVLRAAAGDDGTFAVAREYLHRAGVRVADDGVAGLEVPSSERVAQTAGDPALLPAARALLGALAAVDAIRSTLGLPGRAESELLLLSSEDV